MKKLLLLLGLGCVGGYFYLTADGVGTYSEGYEMGLMSKYSEKGHVLKSGEGELYMGNASSTVVEESGSGDDKTKKQINPRLFSTDAENVNTYKPFEGKYVLIHYKQHRIKGVVYETEYVPIDIKEVDKTLQMKPYETTNASGNYSQGDRTGRIVKASRKGTIVKSYEIILQAGNEGNTFLNMSVEDEGLYNALIPYMQSGSVCKVFYKQKGMRNAITEDTPYEIYRIEPYVAPTL